MQNATKLLSTDRPIAYFCAEYGITDRLPIYSGGLGILAGDIVQEAANLQLPFVAVGLFYKQGYFHQRSNEDGQQEYTQTIIPAEAGLTLLQEDGDTLLIEVPIHERTVYAQVWRFPLGSNSLYLLDTDHWKNTAADRAITDQLYSGGQEKRIMQELVLGVGGLRLTERLKLNPCLYHMNEGHSAFLALELIAKYLDRSGSNFDEAVKRAKQQLVFTNHTLVPAGNDAFPNELISRHLGSYSFSSKLTIERVLALGATETAGHFSMVMLAMRMASVSNAVSKVHAKKAALIWPAYPLRAITNGVHLPAWVSPELQLLYEQAMPGWKQKSSDPKIWNGIHALPNELLWEAHQHLKGQLLDDVYARTGIRLEPNVLTVVWARRFATYKRPDLLFSDIEALKKLLFTKQPIQIIVSGKSHPADVQGKEIIRHIEHLANYELKHRAVFVDDYSISLSKILVAGADIWLNTPIYGLEASGTSGMKAAANGVLQCTVPDGWAAEVEWNGRGFALPVDKTESAIYPLFTKKIVPAYYKRDRSDLPLVWLKLMKESIITISPRFSSQRLVEDYVNQLYKPLLPSALTK